MEVVKTKRYKMACPYCRSELVFTKADIKNPLFGAQHIKCPICKNKIYTGDMLWIYEI